MIRPPATVTKDVWNAFLNFDFSRMNASDNLNNVLINRFPVYHALDWNDAATSYDFFNKPITARVTNLDSGKPNPDTCVWLASPRVYFIDGAKAGAGGAILGKSLVSYGVGTATQAQMNEIAETYQTEEIKRKFIELGVLTSTINKRPLINEALGLWRYPRPGNYEAQAMLAAQFGAAPATFGIAGGVLGNNGNAHSANNYQFVPMQPLLLDGAGLKANISLPGALAIPDINAGATKHNVQIVLEYDSIWFQSNDQ